MKKALVCLMVLMLLASLIPLGCAETAESLYSQAQSLLASGQYAQAADIFDQLGFYEDAARLALFCRALAAGEGGDYDAAIKAFQSLGDYKGSDFLVTYYKARKLDAAAAGDPLNNWEIWLDAAALYGQISLFRDSQARAESSRALAAENKALKEAEMSGKLSQMAAYSVRLAAGVYHTVGLRADGTVVAVGANGDGQCDTAGWTDIVAVAAGQCHTVGLRADGTVAAVGRNGDGQCDTDGWRDIVAVAAGYYHSVGLRADGTVIAVGDNYSGQCDIDGWTDIVAVAAGYEHTVGLRADGTVVAVGHNGYGQCDTDGWTDIVAVAAGENHTVGLRADGTVVAVGTNSGEWPDFGQCNVSDWNLLK